MILLILTGLRGFGCHCVVAVEDGVVRLLCIRILTLTENVKLLEGSIVKGMFLQRGMFIGDRVPYVRLLKVAR